MFGLLCLSLFSLLMGFRRNRHSSPSVSATRASKSLPPIGLLVVGLGNPGAKFHRTRHNIGAEAVKFLAKRLGATPVKSRDKAEAWLAEVGGQALLLACPTTYMNLSGEAVLKLARRCKISVGGGAEELLIVHDELDIPPGRIKLKAGGGLGGHHGLESIRAHLRTADFLRLRIGIGKPPSKEAGADHVLSRPPPDERKLLEEAAERAGDLVISIAADGFDFAVSQAH